MSDKAILQRISGAIGLMNDSPDREVVRRWWTAVGPLLERGTMTCNGSGVLDCYCAGDHCACGFPPDCPGCEECKPATNPQTVMERLCELYDARIAAAGDAEKLTQTADPSIFQKLRHLRWMLTVIPKLPESDKANRWMGFVQGVLFDLNFYTIDELRAHVTEAKG